MKPKRLEFCGINSFSEKAVIDFDSLLAGGIFGIFGDTGSGKTTILDSMIFALYGRIDRTRGGNARSSILIVKRHTSNLILNANGTVSAGCSVWKER